MATIDLYKTRDMLEPLEYSHVPGGFLLTTFVNGVETHNTETIDIDIERNGKKMASFVSPVREGVVVTKEGFETRTHKIPYLKQKRPFTAQEALMRQPGNTVYQGQTPRSFADMEMGKTLAEFDQMFFRREEWMAAQAMQTGKVVIDGEGVSYEVDFGMKAGHLPVLSGTAQWTGADAAIRDNLADWAEIVFDDSGIDPTDAILGKDAARAMMANEDFVSALDTRRVDLGQIDVRKLPNGVRYWGFDKTSGLDLWEYTEKYYDEAADEMKYLIDPKKVVLASQGLRFTRHYGPIQDVETNFIGARYPSNWVEGGQTKTMWVGLQSAPLVALHQIDGVLCAQVIA